MKWQLVSGSEDDWECGPYLVKQKPNGHYGLYFHGKDIGGCAYANVAKMLAEDHSKDCHIWLNKKG